MCKFFGMSRSGCYAFVYRLGRPEKDAALAEAIAQQQNRMNLPLQTGCLLTGQ